MGALSVKEPRSQHFSYCLDLTSMSNPNQTPTPRTGGLSLYANLLDPESSAPGTISKAPVVFKPADAADEGSAKKPQIDSAALRFQPTKDLSCRKNQNPNQHFPNPRQETRQVRAMSLRLPPPLPSQRGQQQRPRWLTGQALMTTTSMVSMEGRRDREVGSEGRRTSRGRNMLLFKTGTIYMTLRDRTAMRSISTVMRRSERSGNGRIGCMRIGWPGSQARRIVTRKIIVRR